MFVGYHGTPFPGLPSTPKGKNQQSPPTIIKLPPRNVQLRKLPLGVTTDSKLRFALALAIYTETNDADVVFSGTVSRRGAPVYGITEMAGPTTTIVPVRIRIDRKSTLLENLRRVQDQALSTAPFEEADLLRIGSLSPEAGAACQIQTLLLMQPDPLRMAPAMFSQWKILYNHGNLSRIPLTLECELHGDSMDIFLRHNSHMETYQAIRVLDRLIHIYELIDTETSFCIDSLNLA